MNSEPDSDEDKAPKREEDSDGEGASSPTKASKSAKSKEKSKPKKTAKLQAKGKGGITVPEYWPWEEAKEPFMKPHVTPADELELIWEAPDVEGLVDFLAKDKGFNEDRVRKGAEKLMKMMNSKQQGRLDGLFTVKPKDESSTPGKSGKEKGKDAKGVKRKGDDKGGAGKKAETSRK